MPALPWLADVLRAEGCRVDEVDGWEDRERPGDFNPIGVLWHHTASTGVSDSNPAAGLSIVVNGRSDLPGPLAQALIDYHGVIRLVSAGRCNHAGTIRGDGRGPLPYGQDGNGLLVGWEIDYQGEGSQPSMTRAQYDAAVLATAAVLRRLGKGADHARGHRETMPTKADPNDVDLDQMRRDVEARLRAGSEPAPRRTGQAGGAAVSWGAGRVDVFGRGGGGRLYVNYAQSGGENFPAWTNLGGALASEPVAVSWGADRLDVVGVGTDGRMQQWWYSRDRWGGPTALGTTAFRGTPTMVSWGPGRLDVLGRAASGELQHASYRSGDGRFSAWSALPGGPVAGDPTAVSWGPDRLDVFATGADGILRHWWFSGGWRGPELLGAATFAGPVSAVSRAKGFLDVFGRDPGGQLLHTYFPRDGRFSPWTVRGSGVAHAPAAVSWGPDRHDLFAVGTDRKTRHWWWDGRSWRGPETLGAATFTGPPAATSWQPGRLDVFGKDTNGAMLHCYYQRGSTPGFSPWKSLGGTFSPPEDRVPAAAYSSA